MKRILLLAALAICAPFAARADGTVDFVVNPATGFSIIKPGSYRLTADTTMTADVSAIFINADNVTIDLGGHTLTGAPGSSTDGIGGIFPTDVTVFNGRINSFGGWAIAIGPHGVIRDCQARSNNRLGAAGAFSAGGYSSFERCYASGNNPTGAGNIEAIKAGDGSRVDQCTVIGHTCSGVLRAIAFFSSNGVMITGNIVRGNVSLAGSFSGIVMVGTSTARGNQISDNQANGGGNAIGIEAAGTGCLIEGNICSNNYVGGSGSGNARGISATGATILRNECSSNSAQAGTNGNGVGIYGNIASSIVGNRCQGNAGVGTGRGAGIHIFANCRVEENFVTANGQALPGWGIRADSGTNLIAKNVIQSNTTAGIYLIDGADTRVHSNQVHQANLFDLSGQMPESLGAGDLANVTY